MVVVAACAAPPKPRPPAPNPAPTVAPATFATFVAHRHFTDDTAWDWTDESRQLVDLVAWAGDVQLAQQAAKLAPRAPVKVHRQVYGALATFDQCVAKKKAMTPLLRRWLGAASPVGRTHE